MLFAFCMGILPDVGFCIITVHRAGVPVLLALGCFCIGGF